MQRVYIWSQQDEGWGGRVCGGLMIWRRSRGLRVAGMRRSCGRFGRGKHKGRAGERARDMWAAPAQGPTPLAQATSITEGASENRQSI